MSETTGPEAERGGSPEAGEGSTADVPLAEGAVSAPGPDGQPRKVSRRFPLFTRDTA
ncbi:hypothetical protein G3I23_41290, partial [Streptomyces sp. SID10115]|nr:hypothetical protein [Streptomyces sp. SID10115]